MRKQLFLLLLGVGLMSGCSRTARLYPVQGPLSAQKPAPVLVGKVSFAVNPRDFSVTLGDGELCRGHFSEVSRPSSGAGTGASSVADSMLAEWDRVYGSGFYVSHVLGAKYYARAVVSGNRGTVLNVEMYRPEEAREKDLVGAVKGVAKDNKDNVYKLVL